VNIPVFDTGMLICVFLFLTVGDVNDWNLPVKTGSVKPLLVIYLCIISYNYKTMDKAVNLNGRIWFETTDGKLLGHGRVELLERIRDSGSLRQAAMQMKMSYRQAWDMVGYMNEHFSSPVVISHRGGKGGGSAELTEKGIQAIEQFKLFQQKFNSFLEENSGLIKV
jgi:molybdate transport system regulatory protein